MLFFTPSAHLGLHRIFGTRMTRIFWNADAADDADFFVLFLNYPAERVLRDLVESIIHVSNFRNEVNRFWSSAKKCFPTNRMR